MRDVKDWELLDLFADTSTSAAVLTVKHTLASESLNTTFSPKYLSQSYEDFMQCILVIFIPTTPTPTSHNPKSQVCFFICFNIAKSSLCYCHTLLRGVGPFPGIWSAYQQPCIHRKLFPPLETINCIKPLSLLLLNVYCLDVRLATYSSSDVM